MSTNALARQVPINNTIQVNVPPGDETGLYYILIANLPWQTSWQQLKDHVRAVCSNVERVEIFNESTSGWISVRGRENFMAAMHLLETTPFNGRPIWADGRNAKEQIPIRRLVSTPEMLSSAPRSPCTPRLASQPIQYATNTPPMMSPASTEYGQWSPGLLGPIMSSPPTAHGLQHSGPMVLTRDYNVGSWVAPLDGNYMTDYSSMSAALHTYPTDSTYPYPPPNDIYGDDATYNTSHGGHHGVVPTERRKIIIKGLAIWAQSDQIKSLLRSRCGFTGSEVGHISVPQAKNGGNRGYATVIFLSESHAARAINRLHRHKFDGKPLDVDYTNEFVSKDEENRKKHHHSSKKHREDKDKKESTKSPSSTSQEKKEKPIKKDVVIANGSSSRSNGSSKKPR